MVEVNDIDNENITTTEEEKQHEKKVDRRKFNKGMEKYALWRYEDGVYNTKPFDPEYFKKYQIKYYHEKTKEKIECPLCGKLTSVHHIRRHQRTKYCIKNNKNI